MMLNYKLNKKQALVILTSLISIFNWITIHKYSDKISTRSNMMLYKITYILPVIFIIVTLDLMNYNK